VNFESAQLDEDLENPEQVLIDVILCMALCHTVIVDKNKGGIYTSASPDELALVYAAK